MSMLYRLREMLFVALAARQVAAGRLLYGGLQPVTIAVT
jgi:hypothetical protein